jgi:hypothetical protein
MTNEQFKASRSGIRLEARREFFVITLYYTISLETASPLSTINPSIHYDTRQIHCIYRDILRLLCGFIFKRSYDPRWNNNHGKDPQFHLLNGSGG